MGVPKFSVDRVGNNTGDDRENDFSLDRAYDLGFRFFGTPAKPIIDQPAVIEKIDGGSEVHASNGVITYTFLDLNHLIGMYNNPTIGFGAAFGLSPYSEEQRDAARASIELWDDLIPQSFRETNGLGADIQFSNSLDPAQAYAFLPTSRAMEVPERRLHQRSQFSRRELDQQLVQQPGLWHDHAGP